MRRVGISAREVAPGVFALEDTCTVYAVRGETVNGRTLGFLIDFGTGLVLDELAACGIDEVTHVLMTHHHRDQGQGLARAVEAGIDVIVPPLERELFADVEAFWQKRRVHNDYVMLSDRDSLMQDVRVAGSAPEYRILRVAGQPLFVQPTPGHTIGSVSYLMERGGRLIAFTGDLIEAPGKVRSLMSLQWTYTGNEGPWMSAYSALALQRMGVDTCLPSHGQPMLQAQEALDLLVNNLQDYINAQRPGAPMNIRRRYHHPYERVSDHLLVNVSSESNSYVLLSETGNALLFDYGYDMTAWFPLGGPRHTQRPWLESLPALKRDFGVQRLEVALPTHYHDDHCAGMNLLREAEGTRLWAPTNVASQLERPLHDDLPCHWFDPIHVDRVLELARPFQWHEYCITAHSLPGHTRHAAAYEFHVDGMNVVATGDHSDAGFLPGVRREKLNYQYRNQMELDDYRRSAQLLTELAPDLLVTGHWGPRKVDAEYLTHLRDTAEELIDLHRRLLNRPDLTDSRAVRMRPYRQVVRADHPVDLEIELLNSGPEPVTARVELSCSGPGATVTAQPGEDTIAPHTAASLSASITVPSGGPSRRVVMADVWFGDDHHGQAAEAILDMEDSHST